LLSLDSGCLLLHPSCLLLDLGALLLPPLVLLSPDLSHLWRRVLVDTECWSMYRERDC